MEPEPTSQGPRVPRSYLEVLRSYKWLLLTTSLIGATLAAVTSIQSPAIYRASAQLLIERASPQVLKLPELLPAETDAFDYFPTQVGILQSRSMAREVVARLALQQHPEFLATVGTASPVAAARAALVSGLQVMLRWIGLAPPPSQPWTIAEMQESDRWLIDAFLSRLSVELLGNSRLVTISFEGGDPELVAQVVNTLAEVYMNRTVELKFNAAQAAMQWLREKVGEERQKIEQAERSLQAFRERENILSPEGGEKILVQKVATLNDMYVQMRVKRLEMESQVQMLQRIAKDPRLGEAFPLAMQNQFMQTLRANSATLEADLAELSERYGFKHPSLKQKEVQLKNLKSQMSQGIEQVRQSVEMQAQIGRMMEEYVKNLIDETKREVFAFHQKAIQYGVLQREVQAQNEVYNLLLRRLNETGVSEQIRVGNASLIDAAEVPRLPVKPRKTRNTVVGLVIGLGIGLSIALGLNALDTSVRSPDDLEQEVGLSFLGAIMRFRTSKMRRGPDEVIVQALPHSAAAEAFRQVRTAVMLASPELPSKALLVTSVAPLEGKTVVIANLAVALAQAGRTVLLVDADMRKPRLGRIFRVGRDGRDDDGPGLVEILGDGINLEAAVRRTPIDRLSLIPCHTAPTNPSELLESERLAVFIANAKEQYNFVLFDSPPLIAVTDPAVLASRVDGVVLVVKGNATPRELLRRAVAKLSDANAAVVGGVLNMVDVRNDSAYYAYAYRYYRKYYDHQGVC